MPEDYLPELKQILATAAQRSPEVVAREFDRLLQEARVMQVNAARLPQLGGNFNYGITETSTASNTSTSTRDSGFFYSFGLSQPIFHWGALKNQSLSARINLLVTEKNSALVYRETSVALRKLYLALIVEKARLRHLRESIRLGTEDVDVAKVRMEAGSISAADLEGEKLRLRETELDFKRAEAEFSASRRRFSRLAGLGIAELPEEKIPDDIPLPKHSEPRVTVMAATLLRENAKSTLEYEIYDLRVHEAELRQKIENTRLLPKIGASANYSLENTTNVNGNLAEQRAVARQSIGIGGSWTIFDSFATRGAKREALAVKRSIEHRKATDIEELLQRVQNLERTLNLDAEQLKLTEIRRDLSTEAHKQISDEVGFGNLPKIDIDRAQLNIRIAEAQSLATRAAYFSHWSEFVALASDDPVLNNLPARYARAKK
jgi:outer membrane protein TolC